MDQTIHPVTASASGKDNGHTLRCVFTGRSMLYASCIARLGALDAEGMRVPADWSECRSARECGRCEAATMRQEELLKGQAIYFKPRNQPAIDSADRRAWHMPGTKAPAAKTEPESWLDVKTAGYADALNAAPAEKPRVAKPAISIAPNESPLEAMRRHAAERRSAASITPN